MALKRESVSWSSRIGAGRERPILGPAARNDGTVAARTNHFDTVTEFAQLGARLLQDARLHA